MSDRSLLVLTSDHPNWSPDDHVVLLGPWCLQKPHEGIPKSIRPAASFSLLPFHWDDREKLHRDYDYLKELHASLLSILSVELNRIHKTGHSRRYWQILLDPWLMAYVGVMFDRWETMRIAMEGRRFFCVNTIADERTEKSHYFSFEDYTSKIMTDEENETLFLDIIRREYPDRIRWITANSNSLQEKPAASPPVKDSVSLRSLLFKIAELLNPFVQRIASRNKYVFHKTLFDPISLFRLSISLGEVPVFLHPELELDGVEIEKMQQASNENFRDFHLSLEPGNAFESYLASRLQDDLPECVLESYEPLRSRLSSAATPKVILTGQSHWMNPLAKTWIAECTERGTKLLILEHGGSFPAREELFNFEEDISDSKGTWFTPYHPKHRQVPPSKLVRSRCIAGPDNSFIRKRKYCLIVGNEYPRYVNRVIFYPMADQCLRSFSMVNEMIRLFSDSVTEATRIRPYHVDCGWNTKSLYSEVHGVDKIHSKGSLKKEFVKARLIICTYPETTFTEAMISGVPTILMYPHECYERNPVAYALIKQLKEAKIIFYDAEEAAVHINKCWDNPLIWWESNLVVTARRSFLSQAAYLGENWLLEWKKILVDSLGSNLLN